MELLRHDDHRSAAYAPCLRGRSGVRAAPRVRGAFGRRRGRRPGVRRREGRAVHTRHVWRFRHPFGPRPMQACVIQLRRCMHQPTMLAPLHILFFRASDACGYFTAAQEGGRGSLTNAHECCCPLDPADVQSVATGRSSSSGLRASSALKITSSGPSRDAPVAEAPVLRAVERVEVSAIHAPVRAIVTIAGVAAGPAEEEVRKERQEPSRVHFFWLSVVCLLFFFFW